MERYYLDLVLNSGQLIRIEAPATLQDDVYSSIENAMKLREWWTPIQFNKCTAEFLGMTLHQLAPLTHQPNTLPLLTMIPENYREDSQGRLVPISTIKPVDLARDEVVNQLAVKAILLAETLRDFRALAFEDIQAFADLSAELYQAPIGGRKGNISLVSFDGRYKVQRAISEVLVFDERLQAAKALIDECLTEWAKDSRDELRALVLDAFQVDKEGTINTGRVLSLRRIKITDPKWVRAMTAIADSLLVSTSRTYFRFYQRDEKGAYVPINLDLANA